MKQFGKTLAARILRSGTRRKTSLLHLAPLPTADWRNRADAACTGILSARRCPHCSGFLQPKLLDLCCCVVVRLLRTELP